MSTKRKAVSSLLARRVRARREEEWEPEPDVSGSGEDDDSEVSEEDARQGDAQSDSESASGQDSEDESGSESDQDTGPPKVDISSISFGALARAQASLPPPSRKSKSKAQQPSAADESPSAAAAAEQPSRPRRKDKPVVPKRSSKHAPQEQSSKKPVSRRRDVVSEDPATSKRAAVRDPRFDPFGTTRLDEIKARKAYAFLDEYRDRELADLKAQLKKTKDEAQRARLKKEVMSMESRRKARAARDEEERLLAEHKKKEKELIAQGKNPFYLKRSEQKKQLLTNKFASMSKGQVDRAIERKRKKVAGREKKELDTIQRVTDRRSR